MFDVQSGANEGFTLELVNARHEKTGLWIKVLGKDSTEFQRLSKQQQRQRLHRMQKAGQTKITPEELEDDALDLLATVTKAWNFKDKEGNPYPCTPSNAINLYRDFPYIREQVDVAVGDRENFIKS
jgi:hypothetical protein